MSNVSLPKALLITVSVLLLLVVAGGSIYVELNKGVVQSEVTTKTRNEALLEKVPQLQSLSTNLEKQEVVQAIAQAGTIEQCEFARGLVINGNDYYEICRSNFSTQSALKEKSFASCDLVADQDAKSSCELSLARQLIREGGSVEVCENLSSDFAENECQFQFYSELAVRSKDKSQCAEIVREGGQAYCELQVDVARLVIDGEDIDCEIFSGRAAEDCREFKSSEQVANENNCINDTENIFASMCHDVFFITGQN